MNIKSSCQQYLIIFTDIPTAGISYVDLDRCTAYSLILPNIFTKHGLIPTDLSRVCLKIIYIVFEKILIL